MKEEKKLSSTTITLMIGTAAFLDVLQWLMAFLFMDWVVTIFAYMTFWLWFIMKGIKLLTPKRFALQSGTLLIEMIPFVAALPAISCMVVLTIFDTKLKEKGLSLESMGRARAMEIRKKNDEASSKIKGFAPRNTNPDPDKKPVSTKVPLKSFDSLNKAA